MVRLSSYSRACLDALRGELAMQYEGRRGGTLQVFRTQKQLDSVGQDIAVLREAGIDYQLLARHELQQVEPALAHSQDKLAGGLRLPNDETRSEERRVGKEGVSTCRSRGLPDP